MDKPIIPRYKGEPKPPKPVRMHAVTPRTIGETAPRLPGGKTHSEGKKERTSYKPNQIVNACQDCGQIMRGPHKGEKVPLDRKASEVTGFVMYKGHPVSHCAGHDCPEALAREAEFSDYLKNRYPEE